MKYGAGKHCCRSPNTVISIVTEQQQMSANSSLSEARMTGPRRKCWRAPIECVSDTKGKCIDRSGTRPGLFEYRAQHSASTDIVPLPPGGLDVAHVYMLIK